jgi:hypothetical protein
MDEIARRLQRVETRVRAAETWALAGPHQRETYLLAEVLWGIGWESRGDAQLDALEASIPLIRRIL